jgi:hypothetical protein
MGRSDTPTDMGSSAIALDASKHPQQSFHFLQIFEAAIQPHVISGLLVGHSSSARLARDGFRESIIRCGVKIDNGLEKPNQGLKKAEKVKNSDQTSGSNLRARYTLTTARGAR